MKNIFLLSLFIFTACPREADIASKNLSIAADEFKVKRRIVFFNGITDKYILAIEGLCSLGNYDTAKLISVTCKTGSGYKKHFLGISDNVTYFVEQLDGEMVNPNQYKVIFRPLSILPDIEVK